MSGLFLLPARGRAEALQLGLTGPPPRTLLSLPRTTPLQGSGRSRGGCELAGTQPALNGLSVSTPAPAAGSWLAAGSRSRYQRCPHWPLPVAAPQAPPLPSCDGVSHRTGSARYHGTPHRPIAPRTGLSPNNARVEQGPQHPKRSIVGPIISSGILASSPSFATSSSFIPSRPLLLCPRPGTHSIRSVCILSLPPLHHHTDTAVPVLLLLRAAIFFGTHTTSRQIDSAALSPTAVVHAIASGRPRH